MPETEPLAARTFSLGDQWSFAALSGDRNPMHVDPVAARRTPAGAPAVHGLHGLLWSLECLARDGLPPIAAIDADFSSFLHPGEEAVLRAGPRVADRIRATLSVETPPSAAAPVATYAVRLGDRAAPPPPAGAFGGLLYDDRNLADPLDTSFEALGTLEGRVAPAAAEAAIRAAFPSLARLIGVCRIGALLATTRLVGMVAPGLHSTFHRLSVVLHGDDEEAADGGVLGFRARAADARYGVATFEIRGLGIGGTVRASRRPPPVRQPATAALRALLPGQPLAGRSALVVGGSRGLGEVVAKLLAAAGAAVELTYLSGVADAENVVDDIRAAGGSARAFRYDCLADADLKLAACAIRPDSAYYFATSRIAGRATPRFSPERFADFRRVYVDGFEAFAEALKRRRPGPLRLFYPSSVFVTDPPPGMVEYAAAKAEGEALCAEMGRRHADLVIDAERLPRLATDQTASMLDGDAADPAEALARTVARVESIDRPANTGRQVSSTARSSARPMSIAAGS